MFLSKKILFAFALISFGDVVTAQSMKFEVFHEGVIDEGKVAGIEVTFYQLDKAAFLKEEISVQLPNDIDSATAFMSHYASSEKGQRKIQGIVDSYQGVGRAYKLGVMKLPAVVIDERYVVYGTSDIHEVISIWQIERGGSSD